MEKKMPASEVSSCGDVDVVANCDSHNETVARIKARNEERTRQEHGKKHCGMSMPIVEMQHVEQRGSVIAQMKNKRNDAHVCVCICKDLQERSEFAFAIPDLGGLF